MLFFFTVTGPPRPWWSHAIVSAHVQHFHNVGMRQSSAPVVNFKLAHRSSSAQTSNTAYRMDHLDSSSIFPQTQSEYSGNWERLDHFKLGDFFKSPCCWPTKHKGYVSTPLWHMFSLRPVSHPRNPPGDFSYTNCRCILGIKTAKGRNNGPPRPTSWSASSFVPPCHRGRTTAAVPVEELAGQSSWKSEMLCKLICWLCIIFLPFGSFCVAKSGKQRLYPLYRL